MERYAKEAPDSARSEPQKTGNWLRWGRIALLLLASAVLLWQLGNTLLLLALALLLAAALAPLVGWLEAHRVPRWAGALLCLLLVVAAIGGGMAYLIPILMHQVAQFADRLPELARQLSGLEVRWARWREEYGFLPRFSEVAELARDQLAALSVWTFAAGGRVLQVLVEVVSVLIVLFFFLKDGPGLLGQALSPLPEHLRCRLHPLLERFGHRLGRFVLGRLLVMVLVGLMIGISLALIGTPYPVLLGTLAGVLDIIPYFGPVIAFFPAALIALSQSWLMVLWVLIIFVVIQQFESIVLSPLLIGKVVGLHPAWIVIAVIGGAEVMGIMGMILAVPIASSVQILITELTPPQAQEQPPESSPESGPAPEVAGEPEPKDQAWPEPTGEL